MSFWTSFRLSRVKLLFNYWKTAATRCQQLNEFDQMKALLDESVPRAPGFDLDGHHVRTAQLQGFSTLSNGRLMQSMLDEGFEVLITFDQN